MLEAADDFVRAADSAVTAANAAIVPVLSEITTGRQLSDPLGLRSMYHEKARSARAAADEARRAAEEAMPRIGLLFGIDAITTKRAAGVVEAIGAVALKLAKASASAEENRPAAEYDAVYQGAIGDMLRAQEELDEFSRAARNALTDGRRFRRVGG